jgi:CRP-like cAMP-binding protein
MNFIKNISLNSQGMNKKIAMSVRKNLRENIIEYFTALSVEQNSNMVLLPVSKKQLADYFGVQRPSFFRELKNMQDQKLIEISNKQVALLFLQSE